MSLQNFLNNVIPRLKIFAKRRATELGDLPAANLRIAEVEIGSDGPRVKYQVSVERFAAWDLYVELNTRVATQSLDDDEGLARETLTSFHALFDITRQLLKTAGPGVALGDESLANYALAILNRVLRPFLSRWHPRLSAWEAERADEVSAFTHEQAWKQHADLRRELGVVREILTGYSEALAILAGVGAGDV